MTSSPVLRTNEGSWTLEQARTTEVASSRLAFRTRLSLQYAADKKSVYVALTQAIESPTSLLWTQETHWITGTKPIKHLTAPGSHIYTLAERHIKTVAQKRQI